MLLTFPAGIESTLLVPVLLGAVAMLALNEWLGWDFAGIVVPGYLASLLMLDPWVAAVVGVETVLAYGLVRALGAALGWAGVAFPVFGRDRFYLVLVVSAVVLIAVEGVALPAVVARLGEAPVAARLVGGVAQLAGMGLVLVPLAANRLWRPGLRRGLLQLGVQTALVAVALLGLSRLTSFSLTSFQLAHDDLETSFLLSTHAQIALLVTAALASHLNRRYGWDFHGILVPALVALGVVAPVRLGATFVEALAIWAVARGLARVPPLRHRVTEGPRQVVLCYAIGFSLKCALAIWVVSWPGYRPTDFFGMGYLLSSLLAERMWRQKGWVRVLVPTFGVAVAGFAGAIAISALFRPAASRLRAVAEASPGLCTPPPCAPPAAGSPMPAPRVRPDRGSLGAAADAAVRRVDSARLRAIEALGEARVSAADAPPRGSLAEAVRRVASSRADPERLAAALAPLGLAVSRDGAGALVLSGPGWPVIVLAPAPWGVLVAPRPSELGTAAAALRLAAVLGADCVLAARADDDPYAAAAALALGPAKPLLVVRGADAEPSRVVERPLVAGPGAFEAIARALDARFGLERAQDPEDAPRVAFPAGAGRLAPSALLWLSPRARWALSGADAAAFATPELEAAAAARGAPIVKADVAAWLAGAAGAPAPAALERLERIARARDVAMLRPGPSGARVVPILDEARGIAGFALEAGSRRAVALAGDRTARRARVGSVADLDRALVEGPRTLLPGGAR